MTPEAVSCDTRNQAAGRADGTLEPTHPSPVFATIMAYQRRLDDEALAAAKLEYETAPLSTRALAAKYGLSKSSMAEWAHREGWVKFQSPQEIEHQLEQDIRVEAQATEGAAFVKGLARSLRATRRRRQASGLLPRSGTNAANKGEPPTRRDRGDAHPVEQAQECQSSELQEPQVSCDRPCRPILANTTAPSETVRPKPGRPKKNSKSAEILPFPAGQHAALARKPDTMLLPVRSKAERDKLKIDLGALRGVLLAQQIDLLDRHEQLLADYGHLLAIYLAPHDHLTLEGLSEAAREEQVVAAQRVALSRLLPTERDSLAGALKVLTSAMATTIQLKLRVADLARAFIRNDDDEDCAGGRARVNELDIPDVAHGASSDASTNGTAGEGSPAAETSATRAN